MPRYPNSTGHVRCTRLVPFPSSLPAPPFRSFPPRDINAYTFRAFPFHSDSVRSTSELFSTLRRFEYVIDVVTKHTDLRSCSFVYSHPLTLIAPSEIFRLSPTSRVSRFRLIVGAIRVNCPALRDNPRRVKNRNSRHGEERKPVERIRGRKEPSPYVWPCVTIRDIKERLSADNHSSDIPEIISSLCPIRSAPSRVLATRSPPLRDFPSPRQSHINYNSRMHNIPACLMRAAKFTLAQNVSVLGLRSKFRVLHCSSLGGIS